MGAKKVPSLMNLSEQMRLLFHLQVKDVPDLEIVKDCCEDTSG
jgi:hypothetical protein